MGLKIRPFSVIRYRPTIAFSALLTTFAGVALLIDRPRGTVLEWVSIPIVIVGGGLLAWCVWPASIPLAEVPPSLASRFLRQLTFGGRLQRFFPVLGIGIIIGDVAYNLALSATPAFQTEDTIVLLAAVTLLGYLFVPERFARERDFVLLFFFWLNAILVVPLLVARLYYANLEQSVDLYSWVALAPEASAILNLLGVSNQLHAVTGSTAPGLTFTPQHLSVPVTVIITTACSGIYSFGIFASAFCAFVLTEYKQMSARLWVVLGLGFGTAYAANILRMVVIILVSYFKDTDQTDLQNLLLAHSYAGWLIFIGWIALFWFGVFKLVPLDPLPHSDVNEQRSGRLELLCEICGQSLTPTVPANRCGCGAYHHRKCEGLIESCPRCGRLLGVVG